MTNKLEQASASSGGDCEIINPPTNLRAAVSTMSAKDYVDPVARAEAALADLSSQFAGWMEAEWERLDQARQALREHGLSKELRAALFHAAHDIKGQAATFGYPLLAAPADSLCRLLEHTPDMMRIPAALVDQHVDAIRAIIRESKRLDIEVMAARVTRRLREVTEEFLVHENRDRPGYLEPVVAPGEMPRDPS